ncbi:hypothetical protein HN908_01285 [Candidatus Woesearchaeota archaeon]|jgi:hypothetical protein|nr:hypothetical protein [Candidatus Woesearchaeota archaeon]
MEELKVLFHGSSNKLIGDKLNPSQGDDSDERPENNQFGVYATDRKDLAIVMGILGCKDVVGGSIDEYQEGKLNARIYGKFPKQEYIYVYHLPVETFKQTEIDKHQFVSLVAVKPIKVEKLEVKDFTHLIQKATKEETDYWMKKYGK